MVTWPAATRASVPTTKVGREERSWERGCSKSASSISAFLSLYTFSTAHVYLFNLTFRLTEMYSGRSSTYSVCLVYSLERGAEVYCLFITIDGSWRLPMSVRDPWERRGASTRYRRGESRLFETILIVVLLEYYCGENIAFNCFNGLYMRKLLIMNIDFKMTLIDT